MKSRRGFLAAVLLLLALPAAVLGQVLFGAGPETIVHVVGAIGFVLLALSFFDFVLPWWVAWTGCAAASALAAIFALQALSTLVPDETLNALAFQVLGGLPERIAVDALLACLLAVCLLESRGVMRTRGLFTLLTVAAVEVYRVSLRLSGAPESAALRLFYLLPFVWVLPESRKARTLEAPAWKGQVV